MLENSKIIIDIDACTKCRACVNECQYYYFDSEILKLHEEFEEGCIECGKCVAVCPVNAINLKVYTGKNLKDVPTKEDSPSFDSLINLFQTRRSRRQFKETPVPKDIIEKILDTAGRYSATANNEENVYFTIVQNREILTKLSDECTKQTKNLVEKFEDLCALSDRLDTSYLRENPYGNALWVKALIFKVAICAGGLMVIWIIPSALKS